MAQVKDQTKAGGQGASAALRKSSETGTGQRGGGHHAPAPAPLAAEQDSTGPLVGYAVAFGRSGDARSLPPSLASSETGEVNELNDEIDRQIAPGANFLNGDATVRAGGGLSTKALATLPASTSFEGLADTDNGAGLVNPSDSNGAVGPNHYVETVNNRVRVYNKAGVAVTPPFRQSSLFASVGGLCATVDDGDPIVLYDKLADRWQISQFAFTATNAPPYHQCIAESINGDPTGAYYVYDFVLPSNNFPDYPKLSTWPDAYYLSTRQFLNGGPFNGEGAIAFDRKKMLAGDPTATLIYFSISSDVSFSSSGMLPLDFDGVLPPPPGMPNIFAIYTAAIFGDPSGDALRLFDFHVDFAVPANSTFTERTDSPMPVAAFDPLNPNGRGDVEQPPPATPADNLDTIGDRLMYRLQYRNREGVESIVAVHTVNVGVHLTTRFPTPAEFQAAPRYYELQRSTPGGPFTIHDQATFSPDAGNPATGLNRWMGSAAIDAQGNLVVGYSTSSTSVFPSVSFAGRAFNETGGLLQGEATIFPGLGSQQASGNRWGDYSALQLDPVDECTFWYVNEYYPAGLTQFNWHTRVGNFKFAGCTPPARGTIVGKVIDCVTGLPIVGALVQASDGHSAATGADGTYTIPVPPGDYSVAASDSFRNCNPATAKNVTVAAAGSSATANFCLTGGSKLDLGAVATDDSLGNSNGIVNRDECVKLTVGIANDGCLLDTNISGTLSTSTPGVTVNQALSKYPNLAVNASANNTTPFAFTTSPGFVCGTPIAFALAVTSDHQPAHTLHFSVPTCVGAPQHFEGSLDASDPQQTARLGRDGNASGCAAPKGCPQALGAGPREFQLFTFPNNASATVCLKVDLTAGCDPATNPIMAGGYLDSFDPSNLCLNYLGDPGGSPGPSNSFSVNVPAGHNLVLNVHEINAGLAGCSAFSGQVSGFIDDAPANGACPACALSTTVATSTLWPANHNLINVGLAATSTGVCPADRVVTVYSDEDDVNASTSGDMSPDAKNLALGTLRLRAERQDSGAGANGRVYLIVTRTSDGTGNGAFSCQTVTVPESQTSGDKSSVAAQAAAALTFCTNNGGSAPAGYFVVGDGPVIGPKQ